MVVPQVVHMVVHTVAHTEVHMVVHQVDGANLKAMLQHQAIQVRIAHDFFLFY